MRILVAVPTFENICPEVFKAIYDLDKCGHKADFDFVKGYDCALARNTIADKALKGKYDYVLMVDSDTIVPKNALQYLLDPQADIVLGLCPRKNTKIHETALYTLKDNPKEKGFCTTINYNELPGEDRVELRGGGFACALIRTDVFHHLHYPYFKYVVNGNKTAVSEDMYFCNSARSKGHRIYADTRVRCGHLIRQFQYQ